MGTNRRGLVNRGQSRTPSQRHEDESPNTICMGASVQSAISPDSTWALTVNVLTPVLAAVLTIANGLSQSFHWGPAWREMAVTATRLQDNYDRIFVTSEDSLDVGAELARVNKLVAQETEGFFDRIFVGSTPAKNSGGQ